ncbi:hypothetical protein C1645_839931 [Glomus cerebriforme]|uniref:Uncharacterized protein n=1 Tax=Glomus cerebriforme TaxID=658196 RepID=A0A397S027_9GLOM|nr:hypothetical protein C1645_839931 [Glomus cerebriforme]
MKKKWYLVKVNKLITENGQLQDELYRERLIVAELKQKIDNLEGSLRQVEEENTLLRKYNGIFGVEMDKLYEENKALQERSPDEANDIAARSEMKHILKGQIPDEYALDYNKTFVKQSDKIYKKLISELKKLMSGHYNPSLKNLLQDVLDPAAEEIQHAKKHRDESDPTRRFRQNRRKLAIAKKSRKEKESKGKKKADPEEETIDAIFNAEVDIILDALYRMNIIDK